MQQAETASSDATDETFRQAARPQQLACAVPPATDFPRASVRGLLPCRLTIDTAEARKSVRFTEVKDKGERRIVVDAVAVGCQAEAVTAHAHALHAT